MKKLLGLTFLSALFFLTGCQRVAPVPGSAVMVPGSVAATGVHMTGDDPVSHAEGSSHAVKKGDGFYIDSDYGQGHMSAE